MDLENAAGNQPLLEVVWVVTVGTHSLVGLLLQAFIPRALLISNPPHLWRQEKESGPLRIKKMAWPGKACRSLCWSPPGGHRPCPLPLACVHCQVSIIMGALSCSWYSACWLCCRSMVSTTSVKMARYDYGKVPESLTVPQQWAVGPGGASEEKALVAGKKPTTRCSWRAQRL